MSSRNFEKIVLGAYYRRQDGKVVGPAERRNQDEMYQWEVEGFSYINEGFVYGDRRVHMANLVARVNEDGSPWVEPVEQATEPEKRLPKVEEPLTAISAYEVGIIKVETFAKKGQFTAKVDSYGWVKFYLGEHELTSFTQNQVELMVELAKLAWNNWKAIRDTK